MDGNAKYVRQNLFFSHQQAPEINSLVTQFARNVAGRVRITQTYTGSITDIAVQVPQVFHRLPASTLTAAADSRFQFFKSKILPTLRIDKLEQSHTLIVIPSYFDFVRIRNYLQEHNYSTGSISEYTSRSKVDRLRNQFVEGEVKFLLYSERYHFFRRTRMKGIKHIVFYGPPTFSKFYGELVNFLADASRDGDVSCQVLFSAYDRLALERVVGSERLVKMMSGSKEAYMFSI